MPGDWKPQPKVGNYLVVTDRWGSDLVGPVTKVTGARAYYSSGRRETYTSFDKIAFHGSLSQTTALHQKLKSTRGNQWRQEQDMRARHVSELSAIIDKAREEGASNVR